MYLIGLNTYGIVAGGSHVESASQLAAGAKAFSQSWCQSNCLTERFNILELQNPRRILCSAELPINELRGLKVAKCFAGIPQPDRQIEGF